MKVDRELLTNAVGLLSKIPDRKALDSSRYVMLSPIKGGNGFTAQLRAEAACQVQVKGEGEWPYQQPVFVDRRFFLPWVKSRTSGKEVQLAGDSDTVHLKCGRSTASLPALETISGYYEFGRAKTNTLELSEDDIATVQASLVAANTDEAEPHLMCVYLDGKGWAFTTDHMSAFFGRVSYKGDVVPLPLPIVPLLTAADKVGVGKDIRLKFTNGLTVQAVPLDAKKEFPIDVVRQGIKAIKQLPVHFTASLSRIAKSLAHLDEATNKSETTVYVTFTLSKDGKHCQLLVRTAENARITDVIPVQGGEPRAKGEEVMLNLKRVQAAVKAFGQLKTEDKATVNIHAGETTFTVLRSGNAGYMIANPSD